MKLFQNDFCVINYSESLEELIDKTLEVLNKKIKEYENIFNINIKDKIVINYFDNLEEFREFIYDIRGNRDSLPEYAKGTYDNGMINAYIDINLLDKKIYNASHELFHILYLKHILNADLRNRIVWYDEGMAQFMSGEKDYLKDEKEFKEFYIQAKQRNRIIPNLNELWHGNSFYNDNYNGYQLSYLSIRYLYEALSEKEFYSLLFDIEKVKEIDCDVADKAINYFSNKLS